MEKQLKDQIIDLQTLINEMQRTIEVTKDCCGGGPKLIEFEGKIQEAKEILDEIQKED
jgi:hypothetical protein